MLCIDSPDLVAILNLADILESRQVSELSDQAVRFISIARAVRSNTGSARRTWLSGATWLMQHVSEARQLF